MKKLIRNRQKPVTSREDMTTYICFMTTYWIKQKSTVKVFLNYPGVFVFYQSSRKQKLKTYVVHKNKSYVLEISRDSSFKMDVNSHSSLENLPQTYHSVFVPLQDTVTLY